MEKEHEAWGFLTAFYSIQKEIKMYYIIFSVVPNISIEKKNEGKVLFKKGKGEAPPPKKCFHSLHTTFKFLEENGLTSQRDTEQMAIHLSFPFLWHISQAGVILGARVFPSALTIGQQEDHCPVFLAGIKHDEASSAFTCQSMPYADLLWLI